MITLGIIGVVAAMTLPTLIHNYQKKVTVNRLKKAYTVMSQAIKLSETQNGEYETWEPYEDSTEFVNKYYKPYIKSVKICDSAYDCGLKHHTGGNCGKNGNCSPWACNDKNKNVTCVGKFNYKSQSVIVLSDGIFVKISTRNENNNNVLPMSQRNIHVDINGASGPNIYGKDYFIFSVQNGNLLPFTYRYTTESQIMNDCSKNGSYKFTCSYKIMQDGWEIADDYPW